MAELKILIGVSASGKSTWAQRFVEKNEKWCIVSRDDLRYAWQNRGVVETKLEHIISDVVEFQIETLLSRGYNVIYDATNLKAEYIRKFWKFRNIADITFQIFDIELKTAISRDAARVLKSVGEVVINKQYTNYLILLSTFDFRPLSKSVPKYSFPLMDKTKGTVVLVDIDGTVAHANGRNMYDYEKVGQDDPDVALSIILQSVSKNIPLIFVSGREDVCRKETEDWLKSNGFPFIELHMRKAGDHRKDSIVKEEIFWNDIEPRYNVLAAFDDRNQVVQMWRDLGIKCLQVQNGNF